MIRHPRLLKARWIAPIDQPPIPSAALLLDSDTILAVGPASKLQDQHPHATVTDLGDSIILPGLINPHTHLELTTLPRDPRPPESFTSWIKSIRNATRSAPPPIESAIAQGIEQCLRFGVTCVGDISQQSHLTRPLLNNSPLRAVSFGEIIALAALRDRFESMLQSAADTTHASPRLRIGLTPHAPYTVEPPLYARCLAESISRNLPLATHLAETPDEAPFLANHTGPFRQLWDSLQLWDPNVPRFQGGPIRLAQAIGLLDHPTLLAHVNYCDDAELRILAAGRAHVVYCPRTHAYFQHPPHRWRDMLAAGINVSLGTDSCATSPDLNIVDDLRLLHQQAPDYPIDQLWNLITQNAAAALGLSPHLGTLSPHKQADLTIFPATTDHPLKDILTQNLLPTSIWIAGHPLPPPTNY